MLSTPSTAHLEEKIQHLQECQHKAEDSAAKYKLCWEKLKKEKEAWEKEREELREEKESSQGQLEDVHIH